MTTRPDAPRGRAADGPAWLGRAWAWVTAGGRYSPDERDLATVGILGLRLPVRATLAIVVVTLLVLLDYHGRVDAFLGFDGGGTPAEALRERALGRLLLLGVLPFAIVVLLFRDRPSRYGIRVGDARAGAVLGLLGCVLMTPVVAVLTGQPDFRTYYAAFATAPADVILTSAIEVIPAEFFYRGFLMFALLRAIGPLAVLIATLPFGFAHLGKPELETLSTLFGGLAYGWLDWRTGSVLWSGLAHTYILSLAVILAAP